MKEFLKPRSIAVIGASKDKKKVGHLILKNLISSKLKIYPINPNEKIILGKKTFKSVLDIKARIDLAVIVVPAEIVPNVLRECGKKKVPATIIISSGFSESGNFELEKEVLELARKNNIKLLGPNCLGIINPHSRLNASFFGEMPDKGNIAFISQSGALGVAVLDWAIQNRVGFSSFISVGNSIDTDITYWISHLGSDKKTKVITVYMEGIENGNEFMNAVKKCGKPVVVLKGGLTEKGKKAAATHTASLSSPEEVYRGAFRQCGAVEVNGLHQLFEVARHMVFSRTPSGKKGLIITNAGGVGVLATDSFEKNGLQIVEIPEKVISKIDSVLPKSWSKGNPIDLIGDATPERYSKIFNIISKSNFYDFVFVALTPQIMTSPDKVAREVIKFSEKSKVPWFTCFMGGNSVKKAKKMLKDNNILNFKEPSYGAKVISKMVEK